MRVWPRGWAPSYMWSDRTDALLQHFHQDDGQFHHPFQGKNPGVRYQSTRHRSTWTETSCFFPSKAQLQFH